VASRSGYVVQGRGSERGYALKQQVVVRDGRRRELWRLGLVAGFLLLLQIPMRLVAQGRLDPVGDVTAAESAHLSLVIDLLMIVAYVYLARRALEMARSHRVDPRFLTVAWAGACAVAVGALMDIWEDVRLWSLVRHGDTALTLSWRQAFFGSAGGSAYTWTLRVLVVAGLLALFVAVLVRTQDVPQPVRSTVAPERTGESDIVICCSGGGIRATAFSMGGLQALREQGIYQRASAVIGVSGGGYIAAAHHVLRWSPSEKDPDGAYEWPPLPEDQPAFGLGSPETRWVRRHTRYVLNSLGVATDAVLSLLFGIAVNLLLVATALWGSAVVLAWLYLASGRLHAWPSLTGVSNQDRTELIAAGMGGEVSGPWECLNWVWVVPALGVLIFLCLKFWDRYSTVTVTSRQWWSARSAELLWVGVALTVVVLGIPAAIDTITHYTATSGSAWAGLLYHLGFVPHDVCQQIVATQSACGAEVKPDLASSSPTVVRSVSFVTVVGSILAVLASAKSASADKQGGGFLGGLVSKVWKKIKDPIVPWTALAVILLIGATVLLVWTTGKVQHFDESQIWPVAGLLAGLLLLTKVTTEPNRTSMHSFFRERISEAFLVRRGRDSIDPVDYHKPLRYSASSPRDGGPRLVSCAVANVTDVELIPSRRGCTPFVFEHDRIGLTDQLLPEAAGLRDSATYEFASDERYRVATIPAATAISAAAFSPLAGRENVRLGPYRAVLALGNARLGVWLPNPLWLDEAFLVRRLLRRQAYGEAASIWYRLPVSERTYLRLRRSERDDIEVGRVLNKITSTLRQLESARRGHDATRLALAERRAVECLTAARATKPSVPRSPEDPGLLPEALRAAAAEVTPKRRRPLELWSNLRDIVQKPGLTRLVKEAVGKASVYDRFLYVTDGGHYDNLGLVEALRRRPDYVIVLDASNDPEDSFRTLGKAIATARMDLDCEVNLDPRDMKKVGTSSPNAAWCRGTYRFADGGRSGDILLVKAIMLGNLSWDIDSYAGQYPDFPRTSTTNQLYSEFDFEAYRALGCEAVNQMLASREYRRARIS